MEATLNSYSPAVLSLFRAVIGFLFAIHGSSTLFAWPIGTGHAGTDPAAPFAPWPGWWSGLIELVTGLLVMVGLFTRPAAFLASGTMAAAYFWIHEPHGLLPIKNGGELAVLYCFSFFLLVFTGEGAYALDARRPAGAVGATTARRRFALRRS
jgi:putative oxidoreductase